MRNIYFVTGSDNKYAEALAYIPGLKRQVIDLPEIQSLDPEEVIVAKLMAARAQTDAAIMVEDTSLSLRGLNGLPGPLVKWFLKSLGGPEGIYDLANRYYDWAAMATTVIGYMDENDDIKTFRGDIEGTIVHPRGDQNFSWDTIFQPEDYAKTFAEMTIEQKNRISHRAIALKKFAEYLRG